MSNGLYAQEGKIHCSDYFEIYIPMSYFNNGIAKNLGSTIQTMGIVYCQLFTGGQGGGIKLLNIPAIVEFMVYETSSETITTKGRSIDCLVLQYLKDAYVLHQTITKGRMVANNFLELMLAGKVPANINYDQILDIWWRNLEYSGISYKVPSKIFEMVIAAIYRNPKNPKERYGQYYGKSDAATGYDYKSGSVRSVVKELSTFSGMVFEDIGTMISNGINNSKAGVEEPVSPLEKIIHY